MSKKLTALKVLLLKCIFFLVTFNTHNPFLYRFQREVNIKADFNDGYSKA